MQLFSRRIKITKVVTAEYLEATLEMFVYHLRRRSGKHQRPVWHKLAPGNQQRIDSHHVERREIEQIHQHLRNTKEYVMSTKNNKCNTARKINTKSVQSLSHVTM